MNFDTSKPAYSFTYPISPTQKKAQISNQELGTNLKDKALRFNHQELKLSVVKKRKFKPRNA